ncbi:hypothetical protein NQ318_015592 [Aromia moschata]|uniref:Glycosyltransferase n=1 Tax=Aromia moschata TaxID=1265417 RepID=A0AAV8X529_9CUCU|nr:hypothetical protein NQ318_015592 [Aromia moschata]
MAYYYAYMSPGALAGSGHGINCGIGLNILVIFPHPGKSHYLVFEPLLKTLAKKGHNLTVLSFCPQETPPQNRGEGGGGDSPTPGVEIIKISDFTGSRKEMYGGVLLLKMFAEESCSVGLQSKNLQEFLKEDNKFDVILAEFFNTNCFMGLVKKYKAPVIGLSSCVWPPWISDWFGNPENPSYIPTVFMDYSDEMTFLERVENTAVLLFDKLVFKLIDEHANMLSEKFVRVDLYEGQHVIYNASLLLSNTHFCLNRPKPLVPSIVEVGGIHITKHKKLPAVSAEVTDELIEEPSAPVTDNTETSREERQENPIPGPSSRPDTVLDSDLQEQNSKNSSSFSIAPFVCHPLPKITNKRSNNKRKSTGTVILTSTPYKKQLEKEKMERAELEGRKKVKAEARLIKNKTVKALKIKNNIRKKEKYCESSSEDSEDTECVLCCENVKSSNLEKWINSSSEGVIYFSLGSMIKGKTFPNDKRQIFLNAFKRLPQRVLWKWEDETMEGKPDNVMVQKWMPQLDILCHPNVKAFISHGGLLGITEAVHCGVPTIVMPQFGDQHTNARALEASGGGVILQLNEATEEKVSKTLKKVLSPG